MKKVILIALCMISGLNLLAQDNEYESYFAVGLKQGANYSSVDFTPTVKVGPHFGYHGGIVFKHQNERLFALLLELNYTQKGWTEDLDTINNSYSRMLNYLEFPLMTHIVFGKRSLKYYVNLGTSFSYLLSENKKMEVNVESYRREYYEKDVENLFEYGLVGEAGVSLNSSIGDFHLGVRYQLTFTDLFKTGDAVTYSASRNTIWNLSISYFFLDNR